MQITGASSAPVVIRKKISLQSKYQIILKSSLVYFVSVTLDISSSDSAVSYSLLGGWSLWHGAAHALMPSRSQVPTPAHFTHRTHILTPPHGNHAPRSRERC